MRSSATGATVKVLPEFIDIYLAAGWRVIESETKGPVMTERDELAQLLTETSRAYIGEYGAYVDEVEAPHLADAILAAGYSKHSTELASAKRAAKTLNEVIEKQCREVLDVTGLHHLINEDGDGHWDVVWMRLHEMREELASLKESTIGRERLRGDAWRDRAQEMDSRAQSLEVELQATKGRDRRRRGGEMSETEAPQEAPQKITIEQLGDEGYSRLMKLISDITAGTGCAVVYAYPELKAPL